MTGHHVKLRKRGTIVIQLGWWWAPPIFFLLSLLAVVLGVVVVSWELSTGGPDTPAVGGVIAFLFGMPVLLISLQSLRHGPEHLRIDIPAGAIHLIVARQPTTIALAELGPFTIQERRSNRTTFYGLCAAGFGDKRLYEHYNRNHVEELRDRLAGLVATSAARAVLAATPHAGGAFREAPALDVALQRAVPDRDQLRAALTALTRDPDPAIGAAAKQELG